MEGWIEKEWSDESGKENRVRTGRCWVAVLGGSRTRFGSFLEDSKRGNCENSLLSECDRRDGEPETRTIRVLEQAAVVTWRGRSMVTGWVEEFGASWPHMTTSPVRVIVPVVFPPAKMEMGRVGVDGYNTCECECM